VDGGIGVVAVDGTAVAPLEGMAVAIRIGAGKRAGSLAGEQEEPEGREESEESGERAAHGLTPSSLDKDTSG
jgi:hypothetical protein